MKITFLGTNGWYSSKTGNTICTLLESKEYYIVLDAGDGIWKLPGLIKKDKPIYIFLSHLHLDHIIGIHSLCRLDKVERKEVTILVAKDYKNSLLRIIDHPYTMSLKKMNFPVRLSGLAPGKHKTPFPLEMRKLSHIDPAYGIRIELDGKVLSYCLDTGICENTVRLSRGADALIHECSNPPGVSNPKWGHVNSVEAARIAKKSGVKKLLLTHFSAASYISLQDRKTSERNARRIFKNTFVAKDDMIINI